MINRRLTIAAVTVYLVSTVFTQSYLILQAVDRARSSKDAAIQRDNLDKQNKVIICILKTQPQDRTDERVEKCEGSQ